MDHHHHQAAQSNNKNQNKRKKRLTQEQVTLLETYFTFNNKLDPDLKSQLAMELGVPPRQVAIWYQNKRARERTQGLEFDHRVMQQRLESVLAENAALNEEIERLKVELSQVHGALSGSMNSSGSCDEIGTNSNFDPRDQLLYANSDGYNYNLFG